MQSFSAVDVAHRFGLCTPGRAVEAGSLVVCTRTSRDPVTGAYVALVHVCDGRRPTLRSSCAGNGTASLHSIIAAVADGSLSAENAINTIEDQCSGEALLVRSWMDSAGTRVNALTYVDVPPVA